MIRSLPITLMIALAISGLTGSALGAAAPPAKDVSALLGPHHPGA
jgi:hypothetical protein